jgi:hypothetical protein
MRGGCPCGEVIALLDEAALDQRPLATTTRKPRNWREEANANGFRATLSPGWRSLRTVLSALLAPVFLMRVAAPLMRRASVGTFETVLLAFALVGVAFAVLTAVAIARRWTFDVANGVLTISTRGERHELRLDDVLGFVASPVERGVGTKKRTDGFSLHVLHAGGGLRKVPLAVSTAAEAQFIADRLTAALVAGGHMVTGGYRGEQAPVAPAGAEQAETFDTPRLRVDAGVRVDAAVAGPEERARRMEEAEEMEDAEEGSGDARARAKTPGSL